MLRDEGAKAHGDKQRMGFFSPPLHAGNVLAARRAGNFSTIPNQNGWRKLSVLSSREIKNDAFAKTVHCDTISKEKRGCLRLFRLTKRWPDCSAHTDEAAAFAHF